MIAPRRPWMHDRINYDRKKESTSTPTHIPALIFVQIYLLWMGIIASLQLKKPYPHACQTAIADEQP